ncbi:TetR/AcrR family transcriptional regulator (plasmid) [Ralstonia pseudosolanacearum]|uniref:TetR/AcrR family transcriptional regulator n=1 Tax=Ralstonia solanacearum TaxID=305 RepID=A0AA92K6A0_RALSL|nr:TetR/AcrR family transcriptional regulator [Ralstonia pseudosolanacearum]QOK99342.1 TetR/AcrR family transcriptional regulator [Ralstonia pseudosolanacearum]
MAQPADTAAPARPKRKNDPERTRADILAVATEEFAEQGFSGARVDMIAERTRTTKRMIYYYFGSKEGLYLAVLEKKYEEIRAFESSLQLSDMDPEAAMRALIGATFDYEESHPEFVRLVAVENIHNARHLAQSKTIANLNVTIVETIQSLLERGRAAGRFRADVQALDLHLLITSFCFFRVSNRATLETAFGQKLGTPKTRARHKQMLCDAVIRYLEGDGPAPA